MSDKSCYDETVDPLVKFKTSVYFHTLDHIIGTIESRLQ